MGEAVRFTHEGRDYDVPVAEATVLADRLMKRADDDVTTPDGGLAVAINAVVAGESVTNIKVTGHEHGSLSMVIAEMYGAGETSDGSALMRLRDAMTPR